MKKIIALLLISSFGQVYGVRVKNNSSIPIEVRLHGGNIRDVMIAVAKPGVDAVLDTADVPGTPDELTANEFIDLTQENHSSAKKLVCGADAKDLIESINIRNKSDKKCLYGDCRVRCYGDMMGVTEEKMLAIHCSPKSHSPCYGILNDDNFVFSLDSNGNGTLKSTYRALRPGKLSKALACKADIRSE